jgi:hypothetical protein
MLGLLIGCADPSVVSHSKQYEESVADDSEQGPMMNVVSFSGNLVWQSVFEEGLVLGSDIYEDWVDTNCTWSFSAGTDSVDVCEDCDYYGVLSYQNPGVGVCDPAPNDPEIGDDSNIMEGYQGVGFNLQEDEFYNHNFEGEFYILTFNHWTIVSSLGCEINEASKTDLWI